jgi:hypothetical protein
MSVINTMLQDLDKRHGRPGGEAVPGDVIRSTKPPVTGVSASQRPAHPGRSGDRFGGGSLVDPAPRSGFDELGRRAVGIGAPRHERSSAG